MAQAIAAASLPLALEQRPDLLLPATRDRLLNLLTFFDPVDSKGIPCNSILREFIGDSIYTDPDWA